MNKIQVTKQQRANAVEALKVMWPSVPAKNVYPALDLWRRDEGDGPVNCGTVACFGGWCAVWPSFQRQGVQPGKWGAPTSKSKRARATTIAKRLFGTPKIFYARGADSREDVGTDHEVVTDRLKNLIRNSEVVS